MLLTSIYIKRSAGIGGPKGQVSIAHSAAQFRLDTHTSIVSKTTGSIHRAREKGSFEINGLRTSAAIWSGPDWMWHRDRTAAVQVCGIVSATGTGWRASRRVSSCELIITAIPSTPNSRWPRLRVAWDCCTAVAEMQVERCEKAEVRLARYRAIVISPGSA